MSIQVNNLQAGYMQYSDEYEKKAIDVLRKGWYITGEELHLFENEWATYNGCNYSVGVASGLDAITMSIKCLGIGPGDEVIVQANTFIASVMGITACGATPIFVEPDEYFGIDATKIEPLITAKTKAILVVHLYGIPCQMDLITNICMHHNLFLIEDCAQSHGATYKGKKTGTFGNVGCFSFYPTKNLGAFGDGGCIITNDQNLDNTLRIYRNYGSEKRYYNKIIGINSRLDEIQAGLLRVKLSHMESIIKEREEIANRYFKGIQNSKIKLPKPRPETRCVWHQFVIQCDSRDNLMEYLYSNGVNSLIHYPIPPHLSEAYSFLGCKKGDYPITELYAETILSIPMYNGLSVQDQNYVIDLLNNY